MLIRVLGSAGDGGVPRWDCACARCAEVRGYEARRRTHASVAVSSDGEGWLLLGATPDVLRQIGSFDGLFPRGDAPPPLVAVALTSLAFADAGGLGALAGAPLTVVCPASFGDRARAAAPPSAVLAPIGDAAYPITRGETDHGLTVRALALDAGAVAFLVEEPAARRSLLWAPRLAEAAALPAEGGGATAVFADASVAAALAPTTQKHRYLIRVAHDAAVLANPASARSGWALAGDHLDLFV